MAEKLTFQARMKGFGVQPDSVPAREVAAFISNFEAAIVATAKANGLSLPEDQMEAVVSLVEIGEGSNTLKFAVLSTAFLAAGIVSSAIATRRYEEIPKLAQEAMAKVSDQADARGWTVEILPDESEIVRGAEISPENPVPHPIEPFIEGVTTVYGICMRVGGADPRAEIRTHKGQLLYIKINHLLAKQLAGRLYEEVGIEGEATWNADTWKMVEFKAIRLNEYQPVDLVEAFEEIARLTAGAWDGVDAVSFVEEIRDEDG